MAALRKPNDPNEKPKIIQKFIKTFDEFAEFANKYRLHYDVYCGISTVKKRDGRISAQKSYLSHRHVLFLDFDMKDCPDIFSPQDATERVTRRVDLHIAACINSGHGFHLYLPIQREREIEIAVDVNKKLAELTEADLKACSPTQIARVPTTYNHKLDDGTYDYNPANQKQWKMVKSVYNNVNLDRFYRPHLDTVKARIETDSQLENPALEIMERQDASCLREMNWSDTKTFYCVKRVRAEGVCKGRRNFWLGRITNLHKVQGNDYDFAKGDILKWNSICNPPKSEKEVIADFDAYWHGDYRLLGCVDSLHNKADIEALEEVCDPAMCLTNRDTNLAITSGDGLKMSTTVLAKSKIRKMSGYHLFLLTLIYFYTCKCNYPTFTVGNLKERLICELGHGHQKWFYRCMTDRQADSCLKDLCNLGLITITPPRNKPNAQKRFHRIKLPKKLREFEDGYIEFFNSAATALQLGAIHYTDYKVYLCLTYHLQRGMSCTLNSLSKFLQMDTSVISKAIRRLADQRMLIIRPVLVTNGTTRYNHYQLNSPDKIKGVLLDTRQDTGLRDYYEIEDDAEILKNTKLMIELIA